MIPYAGFPLSKCLVRIFMCYFSLGENLDWNHQDCDFSRVCFPSLFSLIAHMRDIPTSSNLNFPKTQNIKWEEEMGFSEVEGEQTGLAGQHGAMARTWRDNTGANSGTWITSSFLLVIFKVMVEKTQMKELIYRAELCILILTVWLD